MQLLQLHDKPIEKSETIGIVQLHPKPIEKSETRILISRAYLAESIINNLGDSNSDSSERDTPSKENSSQEKLSSSEEEEESSDSSSIDENSQQQLNRDLQQLYLRIGYQPQPQVDRTVQEGSWDYVYEVEGDQEFYY